MYRGLNKVSVDAKGRMAIPRSYRDRLRQCCGGQMVLTVNPQARCLWLYPLPEWERVEITLQKMPDFDKPSARIKQMMLAYASDCALDSQGRILLPRELRNFAVPNKKIAILGQANKFEIWDNERFEIREQEWLSDIDNGLQVEPSQLLAELSL